MSVSDQLPTKLFETYDGDERIMQLSLGMTLFFPRPFREVGQNLWELWQAYLATVGEKTFTWARLGGGNRSRKVNASTFRTIEAWLTGTKDYGDVCWISIHDGPMDRIHRYSFMLTGYGDVEDPEFDTEACFVEMAFPLEYLDSPGPSAFADTLIRLAAPVPYYCGASGFFLHRSPYEYYETIARVRALSRRFEGVEISANERLCYLASQGITTVNWITFVGNAFVERLGGIDRIQANLPPESALNVQPHGIAIRTGQSPLLGDKNTGKDELTPLRQVYRALRPVQYVDPDYEFDPDEFDGDQTVEWLQRLA